MKRVSSDNRPAKLQRLDDFRRQVPHVSASALSQILQKTIDGIPELLGRREMREARDYQINEVTPYGPLLSHLQLECKDGSFQRLAFINPFAQLYVAAKRCEGFAALLEDRLRLKPNSWDDPWGLILYSDEVAPGNQLSHHNARKAWAIYFSILEFGMSVLSDEEAWFCTAAERSDRVSTAVGGIGQVFTALLKHLFGTAGHTLHHSGILLEFPNGVKHRLFLNLKMVIQDGAAHKFVYFLKGDSGDRFCIECRTLTAVRSGVYAREDDDADPTEQLRCNLVLRRDMDMANDADVRGTVHRLAHVPRAELALREQACGVVHNKFNMLLEPSLDHVVQPITQKAVDWMHALVVHGVWNTVLFLVLTALVAAGHTTIIDDINVFILAWTLPRRRATNMRGLASAFNKARWKAAKKVNYVKCMASDALSLYSIICFYLMSVFHRAGVCSGN